MLSALLAAISLLLCSSPLESQTATLVNVGNHHLDVLRTGHGSPAIVLEAGLGNPLDSWAKVWPGLAGLSTVVAYSRAGLGRSEAAAHPHTASGAVQELHDLLGAMHLRPPYILVGKSYGGILVRLYTSRFPTEVAGLVLVDASHEQQVQRWAAIDSTYPTTLRRFVDSILPLRSAAEAAEWRESMRIQAAGSVDGMRPLPDLPLAVLTSLKGPAHPKYVNQTSEGLAAWRTMHDGWFARSRNAIHLVTTEVSHDIEGEQPDLIVEAVRLVLRWQVPH